MYRSLLLTTKNRILTGFRQISGLKTFKTATAGPSAQSLHAWLILLMLCASCALVVLPQQYLVTKILLSLLMNV